MQLHRLCLLSVPLCVFPLVAQNPAVERSSSDLRAAQIVESALTSSGGRAAVQAVRDFRESGTVTYNWGIEPLHGTATITSMAAGDLRFDISVPGQDRSWYVADGQGKLKENNRITALPFHAGANWGSLTLPIVRLVSRVSSSKFRLSYIGQVTRNGRDLYHVRVERVFSAHEANDKSIAQLETTEFFIDSNSFLIVRIEDVAHPPENMEIRQFHAIDYSDYRNVDGIQVPFSITEHIENAQTWSLQLDQVSLNAGISQADIQF